MSAAVLPAPAPMTVEDFLAWTKMAPEGERYELVEGQVVGMAGDTVGNNRAKMRVYRALSDALRAAGLGCDVFVDGVGVAIDGRSVRIPDVMVQCAPADATSFLATEPVLVVEVVSASSEQRDMIEKLGDYALVPSIAQYLIIVPESRRIVWHRRVGDRAFHTQILTSGDIVLNPPGIALTVDALLGDAA